MSAAGYHHPLVERVGYHAARARAWGRRATLLGIVVRAAVWLAGVGALLLAAPPSLRLGALLPVACLLALPSSLRPGGGWVSIVEVVAIGVAAVMATDGSYPLWRVLVLAVVLYLHHTAAALAAQLRTDAVIPAAVLGHWAVRTGLVVAVTLPVGFGIAVLADRAVVGAATAYVVLGAVAAVGLTVLLVMRARA